MLSNCLLEIFSIAIAIRIIHTVKLLTVGSAQLIVCSTELLHKGSVRYVQFGDCMRESVSRISNA